MTLIIHTPDNPADPAAKVEIHRDRSGIPSHFQKGALDVDLANELYEVTRRIFEEQRVRTERRQSQV